MRYLLLLLCLTGCSSLSQRSYITPDNKGGYTVCMADKGLMLFGIDTCKD